jgi:lysophospholipase L1-like esterase
VSYWYPAPGQNAFNLATPVSTNSLGLRNPEVSASKTAGRRRILAVGDSHTFGFAVAEPDTWPRRLERLLRAEPDAIDAEVINAGVEGLAIEQELQFVKDRLLQLQPDDVILAYYWNDMPMTVEPLAAWPDGQPLVPPSMRAPAAATTATGESSGGAQLVERIRTAAKNSYLLYLLVQRVPMLQMAAFPSIETTWKRLSLKGESSPAIQASWAFVRAQLADLKALSLQARFEPWVLVVPLFEQMTTDEYGTGGYQAHVFRLCQDLGIRVIEPLEAIRRIAPTYPDFFIPFDGHPNGRIYEVVAAEAARALKPRRK